MTKKKHFKIFKDDKKIGIVSDTYEELIGKCSSRFNIKNDCLILCLQDGTEIDDEYFEVLENNEELHIKIDDSLTSSIINRLEKFLQNYQKRHIKNIDEKLKEVLEIKDVSQMLYSLILLDDNSICLASSRVDDMKWFEGLDTKYKTKEDVLKNSAENRMRGYFQKLKKDLESFNELQAFQLLKNLIQDKLKGQRYHSYYFDRSERDANLRLCDDQGLFKCYGDFQAPNCSHHHHINPYKSKEERIIFSTWNFDHIIEKSRSIIPAVKAALEESPNTLNINPDYLFELLFEHRQPSGNIARGNLKLVHIVCHNKCPHKIECDKMSLIKDYSSKEQQRKRMKYS